MHQGAAVEAGVITMDFGVAISLLTLQSDLMPPRISVPLASPRPGRPSQTRRMHRSCFAASGLVVATSVVRLCLGVFLGEGTGGTRVHDKLARE